MSAFMSASSNSAWARRDRVLLAAAALGVVASLALAQGALDFPLDSAPATPAYERALQAMKQECAQGDLQPGAVAACGRLALLLRRMLAPDESSGLVIAADQARVVDANWAADVQGSPAPRMTHAEYDFAQAQRCAILERLCD